MMANLRLLNPDFEYLFFDDKEVREFIDRDFPQYREVFDSFRFPIQRYDFFRYLAIYHYGGFYFDLDVMLASGLTGLSELGCVFPFEGLTYSHLLRQKYRMDWEIGNYAFGASARHPFLEAVIENCVRNLKDPTHAAPMMRGSPFLSKAEFFVLNTTGPGLISRTLAENPEIAKSVAVLFPNDVCDVTTWHRFGNLGVHLMEGSWRVQGGYARRRLAQRWEHWKMQRLLKQSRRLGKTRRFVSVISAPDATPKTWQPTPDKPLVSILIPAFNSQPWIRESIRSAIAQTWEPKEIIVVDDGSTDQTLKIAKQFESQNVRVLTQNQQGAAAARNKAFSVSRGDFIQWLDADDVLAPDKIAQQMKVQQQTGNKRILLSSAWGRFIYRHYRAEFNSTGLWCDLSPLDWLLRKMGQNLFMQTATWLVSRELTEAAGPWDTRLLSDDDGEYFCRVLLASDGVRFVPQSRIYYRGPGLAFRSLSYIGQSSRKVEAHWLSMQLHIAYLRSLEDSERVREACINYLRASLNYFYPESPEIIEQVNRMAKDLGGGLGPPTLSWKYSWIKSILGWHRAKKIQEFLLNCRWSAAQFWDYAMLRLDGLQVVSKPKSVASRLVAKTQGRFQRFTARSFGKHPFVIKSNRPIISFTFDDFPRSALLSGGAILDSVGARGTYYTSLGLMGTQAPTGNMFLSEDLKSLIEQNHELGCHTFSHCDAWKTNPDIFEREIIRNQRALAELFPSASFKSLSYPISVPRGSTKRNTSKHFACSRCGGQTFNVGTVDLNYLSAFFIEQSRENPAHIKSVIDQNQRANGWLIFATHDVSNDPTPWGCTPALFEEIVRYAVKSGAQILPVFEAFELLRAKSSS